MTRAALRALRLCWKVAVSYEVRLFGLRCSAHANLGIQISGNRKRVTTYSFQPPSACCPELSTLKFFSTIRLRFYGKTWSPDRRKLAGHFRRKKTAALDGLIVFV